MKLTDKEKEELQKEKRKIIKKFADAQMATQEINQINNNGKVFLYNDRGYELIYIGYDAYKNLMNQDPINSMNYFSVKDGNVITSKVIEIITEVNGHEKGRRYEVEEVSIPYKELISKYTTPISFFITLGNSSRTPKFIEEVAEKAKKDCNIKLNILYNENIQKIQTEESWIEHTKTYEGNFEKSRSDMRRKKTTVITTKEYTPLLKTTAVKTWLSEQTISYQYMQGELLQVGEPTIIPEESESEPEYEGDDSSYIEQQETGKKEETFSWITRDDTIETTFFSNSYYNEGTASEYKDRVKSSFVNLLKKEYNMPESKEKRIPGMMIESNEEILFTLLGKNPETRNFEQVMRYAMHLYNGKDYGVNELSFDNIYSNSGFSSLGSLIRANDFIVDITKSDSNLVITDRTKLVEAINKCTTGNTQKNLLNEVDNFLAMQNKYNVNAIFAMSVTIIESSAGTNWDLIPKSTYNWYSISGKSSEYGCKEHGGSITTNREWRCYDSFGDATLDFGKLINNYYFLNGQDTVKSIAVGPNGQHSYCDAHWGESVAKQMKAFYKSIGIETQQGGDIVDTAYYVADHYINSGVQVHYAGDSVNESSNNGRIVSLTMQDSWNKPIMQPEKYGITCATYVALTLWQSGLIDEQTINHCGFNGCSGLKTLFTSSSYKEDWNHITNMRELESGDIVFMEGHVGIYVEDGKIIDQNYCVVSADGKDYRGSLCSIKNFTDAYRYAGK